MVRGPQFEKRCTIPYLYLQSLPADEPSGSKHVEDTVKNKILVQKDAFLVVLLLYNAIKCLQLNTSNRTRLLLIFGSKVT